MMTDLNVRLILLLLFKAKKYILHFILIQSGEVGKALLHEVAIS